MNLVHSREEPFAVAGSAALRRRPRRCHVPPDVLVLGMGVDWRPGFRAHRRRRCSLPLRRALHVVRLGRGRNLLCHLRFRHREFREHVFAGRVSSWSRPQDLSRGLGLRDRDPGHELAGVVSTLGYGTTGLSVGQRVFGLADWYRDGTLAEYVAIEARNLAPLPGDVDFTVGASLPISGLTAWQGLFQHGRLQAGQSVLAHGAAGAVGSMVTQLAREAGAYVIGSGRAADRQTVLDFGAKEFIDLDNDNLEDVGKVDLVFDVIGGDIQKRSAALIQAGGTLVTVVGPPETRPSDGLAVDFVVESDRAQLSGIVQRVRDGRLRTNIGNVSTLDDAVAALNPTKRRKGNTIIHIRP
jgi:NADPH:quinone reductase-like Zn-dependent oxidoreductase